MLRLGHANGHMEQKIDNRPILIQAHGQLYVAVVNYCARLTSRLQL